MVVDAVRNRSCRAPARDRYYIHKTKHTVYHPAATARMGAAGDPMAVLDPTLCVKGVSRLRVVDASAMPKLPSINPNISVMAMAEKCADLMRTPRRCSALSWLEPRARPESVRNGIMGSPPRS